MKNKVKMRAILSVVLAAVFAFALAGCDTGTNPGGDETKKLGTPENVAISDTGLITWDAVENATSYVVKVDTQENTTEETHYQILDLSKSFTYSVAARADGYTDSDFSAAKSFSPIAPPSDVRVSLRGENWVGAGRSVVITATVNGGAEKTVTWTLDGEGASLTASGNSATVTADAELDGDTPVTLRATSDDDPAIYAEKTIMLRAYSDLTQEMLDEVGKYDSIEYSGAVEIDLYGIGSYGTLEDSSSLNVQTKMDGTYWYTSYTNSYTNQIQQIFAKNVDGVANYVSVSYMNTEEYTPMVDDRGAVLSWDDSGLYNGFKGLQAKDFTFNEDLWRWEYTGSDETLNAKLVASANPYEFSTKALGLVVDSGEIIGFVAESESDYSIQAGYRAEMTLTVTLNYSDVEIPAVSAYEYSEEEHGLLKSALEKMHSLTSYNMDFYHESGSPLYGSTMSGYEETVTEDLVYLRNYNVTGFTQQGDAVKSFTGEESGYKKIDDNTYNSFYLERREVGSEQTPEYEYYFEAARAFTGSFSGAKPSFAFAPEIFTRVPKSAGERSTQYVVLDTAMMGVASTFYHALGNDDALYGIFSTILDTTAGTIVPTVVINEEGYIEEVFFAYNMTIMYGLVDITFSDFNNAELPGTYENTPLEFESRTAPASWEDGFVVWVTEIDEGTGYEIDVDVPFPEFVAEYFGEGVEIPFFGDALGDTYGYSAPTKRQPSGTGQYVDTLIIYYDVPLDRDYTITTSLNAVTKWLVEEQGFEGLGGNQFTNGVINVLVSDDELDLNIYVWLVQPQAQS